MKITVKKFILRPDRYLLEDESLNQSTGKRIITLRNKKTLKKDWLTVSIRTLSNLECILDDLK